MEKNLRHDLSNQRQRFSIRKLTIGAASVLLGTTFLFGTGNTVQADSNNEPVTRTEETEKQVSAPKNNESNETKQKQDSNNEDKTASPVKQNGETAEKSNNTGKGVESGSSNKGNDDKQEPSKDTDGKEIEKANSNSVDVAINELVAKETASASVAKIDENKKVVKAKSQDTVSTPKALSESEGGGKKYFKRYYY